MIEPIVFYDGACPFCSRVIRFILKNEKNEHLRFSSLQSDYAKKFFLNRGFTEVDMSTFYFVEKGDLYKRSSAALRLIPYLKWFWIWLNIFWIFPKFLRDSIYALIARNRYKIFKEKCDIGVLSAKRNMDINITI
jgi:predicted DCC family thiol-disulfide oxidoreductase YuxK